MPKGRKASRNLATTLSRIVIVKETILRHAHSCLAHPELLEVPAQASALSLWSAVLRRAHGEGRVPALVAEVLDENPAAESLRQVFAAWQREQEGVPAEPSDFDAPPALSWSRVFVPSLASFALGSGLVWGLLGNEPTTGAATNLNPPSMKAAVAEAHAIEAQTERATPPATTNKAHAQTSVEEAYARAPHYEPLLPPTTKKSASPKPVSHPVVIPAGVPVPTANVEWRPRKLGCQKFDKTKSCATCCSAARGDFLMPYPDCSCYFNGTEWDRLHGKAP